MSWLTLALGLIREAASTGMGQDILNDIRGGTKGTKGTKGTTAPTPDAKPGSGPADAEEVGRWMRSVEDRFGVAERNMETLVRMHNAQEESLLRIQKRQRIWNLSLAGAILLLLALVAWLAVAKLTQ
jgi:hypothetical protein